MAACKHNCFFFKTHSPTTIITFLLLLLFSDEAPAGRSPRISAGSQGSAGSPRSRGPGVMGWKEF